MTHQRDLYCYRVPITLGERSIAPIIAAASREDALERAHVLGEDLLKKPYPWQMDRGITRPPGSVVTPLVEVGRPVELHVSRGDHK